MLVGWDPAFPLGLCGVFARLSAAPAAFARIMAATSTGLWPPPDTPLGDGPPAFAVSMHLQTALPCLYGLWTLSDWHSICRTVAMALLQLPNPGFSQTLDRMIFILSSILQGDGEKSASAVSFKRQAIPNVMIGGGRGGGGGGGPRGGGGGV